MFRIPEEERLERMPYRITDKCRACGTCMDECQNGAIEDLGNAFRINSGKCGECGSCMDVCPNEAISED
jgi:uncharacterized Fe-S center protein